MVLILIVVAIVSAGLSDFVAAAVLGVVVIFNVAVGARSLL